MAEIGWVSKGDERGAGDSFTTDRGGSGDADPVYHKRQRALCDALEAVREDSAIAARGGEAADGRTGAAVSSWRIGNFLGGPQVRRLRIRIRASLQRCLTSSKSDAPSGAGWRRPRTSLAEELVFDWGGGDANWRVVRAKAGRGFRGRIRGRGPARDARFAAGRRGSLCGRTTSRAARPLAPRLRWQRDAARSR